MVTQSPSGRRVLGGFAVLAGIVVVAAVLAIQLAPRAGAPGVVKPSPVASDYGPPPAGVALVWVQDPNHPGWLIGLDWTGKPRGTDKISQSLGQFDRVTQAPDGSAFGIEPNGKGGFQLYLDRLGNPSPSPASVINYQYEAWADDSRHVCTMDGLGGHWNLGLMLPGAASTANVVALDPAIVQSGIIALSLVACSARNDRAIIQYSYSGRPTEFWVVRISDGAILEQRTYAAGQLANVAASSDGAVIAENSGESVGQVAPAAAATTIRRTSDLSVVNTLDPSMGVLGFNSDESLALVTLTPWASGVATQLAVIATQSGKMLWSYRGTEEFAGFMAQPDGRDFAVLLQAASDSSFHPSVDLVIVHSDGSATIIPGRYVAP